MSDPILVTSAAGTTGGMTARLLIQSGFGVRAPVHTMDARAERLRELGVKSLKGTCWTLNQ